MIVPANTFIATAEAVSLAGARPRLVDVDPETGLLTAAADRGGDGPARALHHARCTSTAPTVDMDPILELAGAAGIPVVEDACQAHGARYKGRRVGSLGDCGLLLLLSRQEPRRAGATAARS